MSNSLAIATVSAALQVTLQTPVGNAVNNAKVGFSRPDKGDQTTPLVNVYLYQVTPNAAYRNVDLPTRRSDGTLVRRPQAAIDLHYLFTFHGDDKLLEPQRLLGAVVTALHAQPLLARSEIVSTLAKPEYKYLAGSTLADQIESVRLTPTSLSLEEFSKLWSVFFQVEYNLSATYQASVVLLESDDVPQEAPPVQARNLYVVPFRWPQINSIVSQAGADQPIVAGSTLLIDGRQLRGDITLVLLEGQENTPTSVTDTEIVLPVPAGLHAGVQGLQVIQKMLMGTPVKSHRAFESNVAPFVLRPTFTNATAALDPASSATLKITDVTVQLAPKIGQGQRAVLVLNNVTGSPPVSYTSASTPAPGPGDSNQVVIKINNVPTGTYLARVQVDGAESLLTVNGRGQFTGPTVAMP